MTEEERKQRAEARKQPTFIVLHELHSRAPAAWEFARIVGRWVWIEFPGKPDKATRDTLKALGFHWNRKRGAWQHPCGAFSGRSRSDPRGRYGVVLVAGMEAEIEREAAALTAS